MPTDSAQPSTPHSGFMSVPPRSPKLQYVESWAADQDLLVRSIKQLPQGNLKILEAGCGRRWSLNLEGVNYRLTGIDLDPEALKIRVEELRDLHDAILGDLCTPGLIPRETYDVVFSSYVLEHIEEAEVALENMVQGLKRGGILLLRIPDPEGVWGWTAHHTPLSVHVAYYKFILKYRNAGKPGYGPYPTCYAKVVSRQGLREFCERHNCTILEERGHNYYLRSRNLVTLATRIYAQVLSVLSFGSLAWRHNNLTYVIRKN